MAKYSDLDLVRRIGRKSRPLALAAIVLSVASLPSAGGENKVDFYDDFAQPKLGPQWVVEERPGNLQNDNEQYFSRSAVKVDRNGLHLEFAKQSADHIASTNGMRYLGGRIRSRRAFLYGRIEFRARLPRGGGLWPALWLRTPLKQPFDGEIDVVEGFGSNPGVIKSSVRPWVNGKLDHFRCSLLSVSGKLSMFNHYGRCDKADNVIALRDDLAAKYHTYAVDWRPNSVTFSFDGKPYSEIREGVPHKPMVIILNTMISTKFDGPITTDLPQWLDVRFVRVSSASSSFVAE
jgi:beta-glucanase (GH16 family)